MAKLDWLPELENVVLRRNTSWFHKEFISNSHEFKYTIWNDIKTLVFQGRFGDLF